MGHGELRDTLLDDLIFEVGRAALADATLELDSIDSVIIACSDQLDGRAISSMVTAGAAGSHFKDEVNTASASDHAALLAYLRVRSGLDRASLVVSWSKCSEAPVVQVENLTTDPFFDRDIGLSQVSAAALQAARYRQIHRVPDEILAEIVVADRRNGMRNPYAHLKSAPSPEELRSSPTVSWPVKELELPPFSDGACALVLVSPEAAAELGRKAAWITGVGWASETYRLGDRDLATLTSSRLAARQAYEMAGIRSPTEEVDILELHDLSPYHWLMAYEALGFAEPGQAQALVRGGVENLSVAVNPSGGLLSANPGFASGLVRLAEACQQVRGEAHEAPADE